MRTLELIRHLDTLLNTGGICDASQNGLQVEGPDTIRKAAFAVDGSLATIQQAILHKADILIVHHGIFWDKPVRATGPLYSRLKTLFDGNCALYASHLPLDLHPQYGNNAVIAGKLGLEDIAPFGEYHGITIGCGGTLPSPSDLSTLSQNLSSVTGSPCLTVEGGHHCSRIAIVSGGGASMLDQAAQEGFDTLITGESSHSSYHYAKELGVNMIFGGHYATETFGVKALMEHIRKTFSLETVFIDIPTGM